LQSLQNGVPGKIKERHPNVFSMMKMLARKCPTLELFQ